MNSWIRNVKNFRATAFSRYSVMLVLICLVLGYSIIVQLTCDVVITESINVESRPIVSTKWINNKEGRPYAQYGDGSCETAVNQTIILDLFKKWIKLADQLNITYNLGDGCLLGAWRDGHMVPYDKDCDVWVDVRDMEKLENYYKTEAPKPVSEKDGKVYLTIQKDWRIPLSDRIPYSCDGMLVPHLIDQCAFLQPVARLLVGKKLHFDIFSYSISYQTVSIQSGNFIQVALKDFQPFSKCTFEGMESYCPKDPHTVLKRLYKNKLAPLFICRDKRWIPTNGSTR